MRESRVKSAPSVVRSWKAGAGLPGAGASAACAGAAAREKTSAPMRAMRSFIMQNLIPQSGAARRARTRVL